MPHIFISYSRRDIDFAQKIVTALADNKLDTWIDWKSIPKGEDWEQEIYRGIEEADAFLFLISPDSAASVMCNKEIAHAVKNGKRILPIVLRDTDPKIIHPEISKRNWIFCRDGQDDFNKALEEARKTIHTDYEWLKYHTELQVKALKWEQKKDNSRLLRGKELREAEQQLAEVSNQEDPQPTKLQREYILASQRNEIRLRRQITISLVIGFSIMLVLTIFTFQELRIAISRELALQAQILLEGNTYNLSGLYALESNRVSPNENAQEILAELPYKGIFHTSALIGDSSIKSIDWSTDGYLASGAANGTITIWNINEAQPIQTIQSGQGIVYDVAWSPDGRLASAGSNGTVIIWNVQTGKYQKILRGHTRDASSVAWSQDGKLASGSDDASVIVWDIETGEPEHILLGHEYLVSDVAWSPDGLLTSIGDGIIIWDIKNETPAIKINISGESISWSKEGKLASGWSDYSAFVWILEKAGRLELTGYPSPLKYIAWSPSGQLASGADDGAVVIWNLDNGKPAKILRESNSPINHIAWSSDEHLAAAYSDGMIIIWDIKGGTSVKDYFTSTANINQVLWSSDGKLASISGDHKVVLWNKKTGMADQVLSGHKTSVNDADWFLDNRLATMSYDGEVIIWEIQDKSNYRIIKILESGQEPVNGVAWSPSGELATGDKETVLVWDLDTGHPSRILKGHTGNVYSLDWGSDGRLASASENGDIIIWDLDTNTPLKILNGDPYSSLDWSSDGRLASGSVEGNVIIWDIDKSTQSVILKYHKVSVHHLSWSPDGRLASMDSDGIIVIWDIKARKPSVILHGHPDSGSIAWSPNGYLASGSYDGTLKVLSPLWTQPACQWVIRNLTQEEWINYYGWIFVYKPTCPNLPSAKIDWFLTSRGRFWAITVLVLNIMLIYSTTKWITNKFLRKPIDKSF